MFISFKIMIWIALAAASISYTIGQSSIFLDFRDIIGNKSQKWEEFINCPYCIAHWIILIIMTIIGLFVNIPDSYSFFEYAIDFTITLFAIIAMTAVIHYFINNAYGGEKSSFFRAKEKAKNNSQNKN